MNDNQNTAYEYYAFYHKQIKDVIKTSSMEELKQMLKAVSEIKNKGNKGDIMSTTIKFAKVNPNAIIPSKEIGNAGYDIYACFSEDFIVINPLETKLIPTGIASCVDVEYYLQVEERGSSGSKGIKKSAGIIDSNYRGEIFIAITNCNSKPLVITKETDTSNLNDDYIVYPYSKAIAQLILHNSIPTNVEEITYEELKTIPSERGCGALGSSGK